MKKDELFDLIKSLSSNEKRYFKLFAKQHGEGSNQKYLMLFDAFDRLPEYDLDALEAALPEQRILTYLNQEKKYLKEKILDALRLYHADRSVESKLFRLLEDQAIFYDKGLYLQCEKKLEQAKKMAESFDRFSMLVEILALERKLVVEIRPKEMRQVMARIQAEQVEAMERQANLIAYQNIWLELFTEYRSEGYRSPANLPPSFQEMKRHPLLEGIERALSFSARHLFLACKSLIARLEGQFEICAQLDEELIKRWEERPDRIAEEPRQYMLALANSLNIQHKLERYDRFPEVLKKIRAISQRSFDDEAETFQNVIHLELLYQMNVDMGDDSILLKQRLEGEIKSGLSKYGNKVNPARQLALFHNLMILNFFMDDWRGANHWRNAIDNHEDAKKVRREIFDFAKVMEVILQYEQEEYDWIQALYRNHRRSLERDDRLSDFYSVLLRGLNKLSGLDDGDKVECLEALGKDLDKVLASTGVAQLVGAQEVMLWIQARLTKRPLREFLHGRNR